jgi:hypothetical protein
VHHIVSGLFELIHHLLDRKYPLLGRVNVTFLKKLETVVLSIVSAITNLNLLPLIQKAIPATATNVVAAVDRLRAAFDVIITAGQMFTAANGPDAKTGSQKLKAATPYVAALIHSVIAELKPGQKPKDEAAFEDACTRATAAFADALNSYGD